MADIICKFLTLREGKALTFGLVIDQRGSGGDAPAGLRALALMANRHPGACAFGKIVLLRDDGVHTFQAMANGDTVPAYCGNSTAAALASLGADGPVRTRVHGNGAGGCEVWADVRANEVEQRWIVPAEAARERRWRGRRVLTLATLNHYAIVDGALPAGLSPEAVRRELLGRRAGKLAVVNGVQGEAIVHFYNANGRHGAVPQTGAASIALAARQAPWLDACFPDGRLTYVCEGVAMTAALPRVSATADARLAIDMPATEVSLTPLAMEMVA